MHEARDTAALLPEYRGLELLGGTLPREREGWPKFATRRTMDASGDFYDLALEEVVEYADGMVWNWPQRTHFFLCDMHADAEAFFRSLLATGGVVKAGRDDSDFELTAEGREARFVIGGDCFDKGPSNLRLLRALAALRNSGAEVEILAGNHDVRALVGLEYLGRKEPRLAHLFVRMGKKSIPLFKEIYDAYLAGGNGQRRRSEDELRALLFPDPSWYADFPDAVRGVVLEKRIKNELVRIREKVQEMEDSRQSMGMNLGMIYAAAEQARQLFRTPGGEFHWFFEEMTLARREGSLLFIHAGVDNLVAAQLEREGVGALNADFRRLMREDLFELYHGPVGNTFRTKYRDSDLPFSGRGGRDLRRAGIFAIVHGHRNIPRGQRVVLRRRILNFECDATVDANTRKLLGLQGVGGAATIISPGGTITGISTDYPYAKTFDIRMLA